jgi:hypothetical protein
MNPQEIHWSVFNKGRCLKRMAHHYLGDPQLAPDRVQMERSLHEAVTRVVASTDHRAEVTAVHRVVNQLPERLQPGAFQRFNAAAQNAKESLPDDLETRHVTWFDHDLERSFAADVLIEDVNGKEVTVYEILRDGEVKPSQIARMLYKGFVLGAYLNYRERFTAALRLVVMRPGKGGPNPTPCRVLWDVYFDHSEARIATILAECRAHVRNLQSQIDGHAIEATTGKHCQSCPFMFGCKAGKRHCFGREDAVPYSFSSVLDLETAEIAGSA